MSALSNFAENALINHIFRGVPYAAPTTIYVALFTTAPGESGPGSGEVPTAGSGYQRQGLATTPTASSQWTAPVDGDTSNSVAVTWATATTNWGTITHLGLLDALTGGNLLFYGALTASKIVNSGDTFKINAGDLDVALA